MKDAKNNKQVSSEAQLSMVLFRLDRQTFAIPITNVRQIIEMVTITPVPQVVQSVVGMINFHGATVPVINLRKHLGMHEQAARLHTPIILATVSGRMLGLLVDDVLDVMGFSPSQLINPADVLPIELGDLPIISNMAQTPQGMVIVLNPDQLFKVNHARDFFKVTDAIELTAKVEAARQEEAPAPRPEPVSRPKPVPAPRQEVLPAKVPAKPAESPKAPEPSKTAQPAKKAEKSSKPVKKPKATPAPVAVKSAREAVDVALPPAPEPVKPEETPA
jgi:purine-binding chemotaxis protein CheW